MAEHKVPQDVEAEDKLLGPLSFRQFIYAMIALGGAALTYFIISAGIPVPLKAFAIVPILVFLCFGTLAIPRKGQPMETYIGALIHFYFQPTKRLWDPDGQESLVEITNPTIDPMLHKIKEIGGAEAAQRLSFLSDLEDSQGWSTRGNINLNDDYALAANMAVDVFDDSSLNEKLGAKLAESEQKVHDEAVAKMNAPVPAPPPVVQAGFAPPIYATPVEPVIVTPPPTPAPAASAPTAEYDEASLSAMLKQSAANSGMTAFQQTVIQPPNSSPVLNNPTLATTATPATMAPVSVSVPPPAPAPVPEPAPVSTPTPAPPPPPPPPPPPEPVLVPEPPKPAIIDQGNVNTVGPSVEEIISHEAGADNSNQSGEISLH